MKIKPHYQILLAIFLGFLVSNLESSSIFIPLGEIFIRLLKMVIVPLVFTSIVVGISSVAGTVNIGKLGTKTVGYYFFTSLIAILIGLFLANTVQPGIYFSLESSNSIPPKELLDTSASFKDLIFRIIPTNPILALVNGDMLSIIFFALFLGYSITKIKEDHKVKLNSFMIALNDAIMYLTNLIIKLTPIGVFGLIIKAVHSSSSNIIPSIGVYMLTIFSGLLLHLFLILPLIFFLFTKISPLKHYKSISRAMLTAFSTSSSSATLPVTLSCVQDDVGVSKSTSSFVLPLGATINMDGTALYECAGVLFIAQVLGIDLTIYQQLTVVLTALLASVGAAGIPSAGLVMIFIVLQSVGLADHPQVGIIVGTMLAVDRPLDMLRTTVNVTSDSIGAAIIASSEGERLYNN